MRTTTSKKAEKLIREFTARESSTITYILRLMAETMEHYLKCENELKFHEGAEKKRYTDAMRTAHEKTFTLGYIAQCLGLQVMPDWDSKGITVEVL